MHYFAAVIFLLVGFILIAVVTCVLAVLTRWNRISPGICAIVVFVAASACFIDRYSFNWHTLLRPLLVSILMYAAMSVGLAVARRVPEGENSEKLW